jgi:hypothetical protein
MKRSPDKALLVLVVASAFILFPASAQDAASSPNAGTAKIGKSRSNIQNNRTAAAPAASAPASSASSQWTKGGGASVGRAAAASAVK